MQNHAGRGGLLLAMLVLALSLSLPMAAGPVRAQSSLKDRLGGFSTNPDAPIDIEADMLEVDDVKKTAIFRGNVKAVQGDFTLRSKEMVVTYSGSAGKGKDRGKAKGKGKGDGKAKGEDEGRSSSSSGSGHRAGAGSRIIRIDARGKVLITSKDKRSATSDWAIFDVEGQMVTIGGHAILSQNGDVIKAEKVVIDLATGRTRFEMSTQRVRMLVSPRPRRDKQTKTGKGKTGAGKGETGAGKSETGAGWHVDVAPGRNRTSSSPVMRGEMAP